MALIVLVIVLMIPQHIQIILFLLICNANDVTSLFWTAVNVQHPNNVPLVIMVFNNIFFNKKK